MKITTVKITVEERQSDYIAYLNDDIGKWGRGKTEQEAIGDLVLSWCNEMGIKICSDKMDIMVKK